MAVAQIKHGTLVLLPELRPGSSFCVPNASLRVTGRLESYDVETGMAVITEGGSSLKVDTQHLRDLHLRINSLFQFIGELEFRPGPENSETMLLQARVGRNVDGLNLQLYEKALHLRRQFEQQHK